MSRTRHIYLIYGWSLTRKHNYFSALYSPYNKSCKVAWFLNANTHDDRSEPTLVGWYQNYWDIQWVNVVCSKDEWILVNSRMKKTDHGQMVEWYWRILTIGRIILPFVHRLWTNGRTVNQENVPSKLDNVPHWKYCVCTHSCARCAARRRRRPCLPPWRRCTAGNATRRGATGSDAGRQFNRTITTTVLDLDSTLRLVLLLTFCISKEQLADDRYG